jgi:hypothetical protein
VTNGTRPANNGHFVAGASRMLNDTPSTLDPDRYRRGLTREKQTAFFKVLVERDGMKCQRCGKVSADLKMTLQVSQAKGGKRNLSNYILVHGRRCPRA